MSWESVLNGMPFSQYFPAPGCYNMCKGEALIRDHDSKVLRRQRCSGGALVLANSMPSGHHKSSRFSEEELFCCSR